MKIYLVFIELKATQVNRDFQRVPFIIRHRKPVVQQEVIIGPPAIRIENLLASVIRVLVRWKQPEIAVTHTVVVVFSGYVAVIKAVGKRN